MWFTGAAQRGDKAKTTDNLIQNNLQIVFVLQIRSCDKEDRATISKLTAICTCTK